MSIKQLPIETVFSGVIHLLWLTLLELCLLGKSPEIIINYLANIGSGTAVFLIAFTFSLSFFLGRIAEHFIIAVNYFRNNEDKKAKSIKLFEGTSGEIWGNKIFSFSSTCGLLILGIMLCILIDSWDIKWKILLIDLLLLIPTITSTIYWYIFEKSISNPNNK
jgi:MFS family permease